MSDELTDDVCVLLAGVCDQDLQALGDTAFRRAVGRAQPNLVGGDGLAADETIAAFQDSL